MNIFLLYQFTLYGLLAHGSARAIGNSTQSESGAIIADAGLNPINYISSFSLTKTDIPDCEHLRHKPHQDPRWDNGTVHLAKCECWRSGLLRKCEAVIPNDHIFDKTNIGKTVEDCGKIVYDSLSRFWTGKSGRNCQLDHQNVAHLTWKNGIATKMKHIKKGFDTGTCRQFPDVQCIKVKGPSR